MLDELCLSVTADDCCHRQISVSLASLKRSIQSNPWQFNLLLLKPFCVCVCVCVCVCGMTDVVALLPV